MGFQFDFDTCITAFTIATDDTNGLRTIVNNYISVLREKVPSFWTGEDANSFLESLNKYSDIVEKLNSALNISELYFKEIKSFYEKTNDTIRRKYPDVN